MPQRDPVLIVMKTTRVRRPDGRVITLMPGLKSDATSDRIKAALPAWRDTLKGLKAKGRVVEDTPPW